MIERANRVFSKTADQKVLGFLCRNPSRAYFSAEVALQTLLSKGGVNQVLRSLAERGVLKAEKRGRMIFYQVDAKSPLIRQFKILRNVELLEPLVRKIKGDCERLVLFGSCAVGEDAEESDVDLYVVTGQKEKVRRAIPGVIEGREVQAVLHSPQEFLALDKKEPVLRTELKKGIILWERE